MSGSGSRSELDEACDIAAWFAEVFGDRYFIEIQNNGLEVQQLAMQGAVDVARRMGLPLVATSDAHYLKREDAEAQDVLLCINTGKFRTDTKRIKMEGDQFYLRGPQEMYTAFPGHEEAVKRSQEIADRIDIELDLGQRHFPSFSPPAEKSSSDYLRELCITGLRERYGTDELSDEVVKRLDRELHVINKLEFANYFLIVWDFVRYAREQGIPATARGSGVGSLVCYALYLSHVCPLKYDLLFERFLDESRREAPDIDIDFCKERRGEVIQYVKAKYGEANVSQIGTFGTLAARAAIRDVGRALGMPLYRVDAVVAQVPDVLGITIRKALETSDDLRRQYDSDGDVRQLLDLAMKIEGLARNLGTHAAAVVIADRPLEQYVPLCRVTGKTENITQWSMNDVERAGLLKMDFLGLRNLTILSKAVSLIEESRNIKLDPHHFPLDDAATFELLCRGETKGIFQLESGGIRDLLQRMKPDHFRDVIATNALYRPGPLEGGMVDDYIEVKHGRKQAAYPHPVMQQVLAETHGVMVYQEQVMLILNRLGGIGLSDAYTCIKAISKKKLSVIAHFKEAFVQGAGEQGLGQKKARELFEMIEKFAGYGFNKSHSTAYALIAYMTAYLKTHYPVEFMAALLSGDIPGRNFKKKDALVEHLEDCRRMEIPVVPPNVNLSAVDFRVIDGQIVFGLSAVKGCGHGAAGAIVAAREAGGSFQSLYDFGERVDAQDCNRATMETLIKAGSLDCLGAHRAQLMAGLDRALQAGAAAQADRRQGQKGLFEDFDEENETHDPRADLPDVAAWQEKEQAAFEKEVLGFYLSSHPLEEHQPRLAMYCSHEVSQLADESHRAEVLVGGMIASIKFSHTKTPRAGSMHTKYAMFDLEDMSGIVRCILWPEPFAAFGHWVQGERIVAAAGTVDRRPGSEDVNLIVHELIPVDALDGRYSSAIMMRIREDTHGVRSLEQLREILQGYPGDKEVRLLLCLADGHRVQLRCPEQRVALVPELRQRVDNLLGPGNFRLLRGTPVGAGAARGSAGRRSGNGKTGPLAGE